ncbi:MAG: hypothetical protein ACE5Z5_08330 [Candidatus Bathyarchaeia archaeon]
MSDDASSVESPTCSLEAGQWITLALCVFVIACYGAYLWQLYRSSLIFASKFGDHVDMIQLLESLYYFGRLGIVAFAMAESLVVCWCLRSGSINFRRFLYLIIIVVVSNLLAYATVTHLYHYASIILGEPG